MKKTSLWRICAIFVAVASFVIDCRSFAQEPPSCDERSVTYDTFDERFNSNIAVQPGPVNVLNMGEKHFSPQRTIWMTVSQPDSTKPGSVEHTSLYPRSKRRDTSTANFQKPRERGCTP
jgi:hypothetical protein